MSAREPREPSYSSGEARPCPESRSSRPGSLRYGYALLAFLALGRVDGAFAPPDVHGAEGAVEEKEKGTTDEEREYQIKAAFLLNFIRYTTWPKSAFEDERSPIVMAVVGKDPFGRILDETFKDEKVDGRKVVLRRVEAVPEELDAQLVFCGPLTVEERERLIDVCAKRAVLLVGESPGFAEAGACVNFYLQERKTRFEINTDALAAGKLAMSPAVLKLAKIVHTRREP